jgi:hypothetical protein
MDSKRQAKVLAVDGRIPSFLCILDLAASGAFSSLYSWDREDGQIMAKLPSFRRIAADMISKDYPDLSELLVAPLNSFMESVTRALNKQITFSDNMDAQVITLTVDGSYPLKARWDRPSKPVAIWIGQIARVDGAAAALASAVTLDWSYNQSAQIEIANIVGLSASASNQYYVTIIGVVS